MLNQEKSTNNTKNTSNVFAKKRSENKELHVKRNSWVNQAYTFLHVVGFDVGYIPITFLHID